MVGGFVVRLGVLVEIAQFFARMVLVVQTSLIEVIEASSPSPALSVRSEVALVLPAALVPPPSVAPAPLSLSGHPPVR